MPLSENYCENLNAGEPQSAVEARWRSYTRADQAHRVLPDGRCDVILRFPSDGTKPTGPITCIVVGPATRYRMVEIKAGTGFLGVRLRPGFAHLVLGVDLRMIRDRALIGKEAVALVPSLSSFLQADLGVDDLALSLDGFVRDRFRAERIDLVALDLIRTLHVTGGRLSIADTARLHGIHPRTAQRKILQATGLSPKQFAAVIRFHRALRLREAHLDAASAACEAGFADQAHMTRAFRAMGGISAARLPQLILAELPD